MRRFYPPAEGVQLMLCENERDRLKTLTMKTYTLLKQFILLTIIAITPFGKSVYAQVIESPCVYDNGCFLIEYEKVTVNTTANPATVTIILSPFVNTGSAGCPQIDYITITPTFRNNQFRFSGAQLSTGQPISVTINNSAFNNRLSIIINYVGTVGVDNVELIYDPDTECLEPQPIELSSFTGLATQSGVNLNWTTASEENNSHFEVQRSSDGQVYDQIATVQGRGNSSVTQKYTFLDVSPKQGINYYRLKQVDFDGQSSYSKIIAVQSRSSKEMRVTVAPNPCRNGDCEVVLQGLKGTRKTLLELKDMSGKVVLTKMVEDGTARLSPDEVRNHKGLFILSATSGNEVVHQRIILE